ncbi:hypothetical protein [uncultured Helicobacter sp.]|uniref:hypothetical protein n=1 Tax=uncultured Helicobacter sp. TaxID=175537 RepID=UPI00374ED797
MCLKSRSSFGVGALGSRFGIGVDSKLCVCPPPILALKAKLSLLITLTHAIIHALKFLTIPSLSRPRL